MLNFDEVKKAANLVAIVGSYITLKPEGSRYVALCPFHQEKSGSFKIEKGQNTWRCYGCSEHGDAIDFVQKYENISKTDALKRVAEFAGIQVVADRPTAVSPKPAAMPAAKQASPKKTAAFHPKKLIESYDYQNRDGSLAYQVMRFHEQPVENNGTKYKKHFSQRYEHADGSWVWGITEGYFVKRETGWYSTKLRADAEASEIPAGAVLFPAVERLLWKLPAVAAASEVLITEGERDAQTLTALGLVATTASGGSQAPWLESFTHELTGKRVIIFPDNDAPGEKYGRLVEKALNGKAAELLYVQMPSGFKDVTEYVEAGHTADDIRSLIGAVEREMIEKEDRHRGLLSPIEIVDRFPGGIDAFIDSKKREKGLQTGFYKFDELTLGLHPGELFILAGRPAMGKSCFAGNIALNVAMKQKKGVGFFTLEMTRAAVLQRMMCSAGLIDAHKHRAGWLSGYEKDVARDTLYAINNCPVRIDETAGITLSEFERKLNLMRSEMDLGLVVIDYLQLVSDERKKRSSSRVEDVSALSRGLKIMAQQMRIPFLVLSQLSRSPETRPGDHRPMLSDLRESGSIEQDADSVGFIYREEVYRPDKESIKGIAELILAKQRNGPTGTVKMAFMGRFNKFDNLAEHYEEAA